MATKGKGILFYITCTAIVVIESNHLHELNSSDESIRNEQIAYLVSEYFVHFSDEDKRLVSFLCYKCGSSQVNAILLKMNSINLRAVHTEFLSELKKKDKEIQKFRTNHIRSDYIVILTETHSVDNLVQQAIVLPEWNFRAQVIVVINVVMTSKTLRATHLKLSRNKLYSNVIISLDNAYSQSLAHSKDNSLVVSTYNPFTDLLRSIVIPTCNKVNINCATIREMKQLVGENKFKNLHGYALKTSSFNAPPYFQLFRDSNGNNHFIGYDWEMFNLIANKINFSTILVKNYPFPNAGTKLFNGSWTGIVGDLRSGEAELSATSLLLHASRFQAVEYSVPLTNEYISFVVPKAQLLPSWMSIFLPFEPMTWLLVGLTLLLCIAFMKISNEIITSTRTQLQWLDVFSIICEEAIPKYPTRIVFRMLFFIWCCFCVVICNLYKGSLVSFITIPHYYPDIDTFEQIANSDLNIVCVPSLAPLIQTSGSDNFKLMSTRLKSTKDQKAAISSVTSERNIALFNPKMNSQYLLLELHKRDAFSDRLAHIATEEYGEFYLCFVTPHGSPFMPLINNFIFKAVEAGLVNKLIRDYTGQYYPLVALSSEIRISLDQLQSAFIILSGGFLISLGTLFWEFYNHYYGCKFR